MANYINPIRMALLISPYLGLLAAMPYAIFCYKNDSRVPVNRCAYIYIFTIYVLSAYFMTMMPFPSEEQVARLTTPYVQFIPFYNVADFYTNSGFIFSELGTYLPSLKSGIFLEIAFNVVMMLPLGFLLRFIFNMDFKRVLLLSFLTSLVFELTQLSGLFFIYSRPYRICDIDDLMTNTLGGVLGYYLVPPLQKYLPSSSKNDKRKILRGIDVSLWRRFAASLIDAALILAVSITAGKFIMGVGIAGSGAKMLALYFIFLAVLLFYHGLFYFVLKGQTPGILLAGLRLYGAGRTPLKLGSALVRPLIIYGAVYATPFFVWVLLSRAASRGPLTALVLVAVGAVLMIFFTVYVFSLMLYGVTRGYVLIYDRIAKTKLVYEHEIIGKTSENIRLIMSEALNQTGLWQISDKVVEELNAEKLDKDDLLRIRIMVKAVLTDWINAGFEGNLCELRMDTRFFRRALILSVESDAPVSLEDFLDSEELDYINGKECRTELVRNLKLSIDTYYGDGRNFCAIDMNGI